MELHTMEVSPTCLIIALPPPTPVASKVWNISPDSCANKSVKWNAYNEHQSWESPSDPHPLRVFPVSCAQLNVNVASVRVTSDRLRWRHLAPQSVLKCKVPSLFVRIVKFHLKQTTQTSSHLPLPLPIPYPLLSHSQNGPQLSFILSSSSLLAFTLLLLLWGLSFCGSALCP